MVAMKRKTILIRITIINILFFLLCRQYMFLQKSKLNGIELDAVAKTIYAQQVIGNKLIGEEYTPITTTMGAHDAKILSKEPDFAAVIVDMLSRAGVQAGDVVAVNMSSSFPALNIAALSAIDAMSAIPVVVSSVGASSWGANRASYTWLDMEQNLIKAGIWKWESSAVTIGGGQDQGQGLSEEGIEDIHLAIARSGVPFMSSASLTEAIDKRIALYKEANNGILPRVLVNVGGNHVIFGERGHDAFLRQGLTRGYRPALVISNGLAAEFIKTNRAVIHLINVRRLAAEYGIYNGAQPGTSKVFYARILSSGLKVVICGWIIGMLLLLYYGKRKEWWK
jgi:poly-gamma-glutamate system protein